MHSGCKLQPPKKVLLLNASGGIYGKVNHCHLLVILYKATILPFSKKENADYSAISTWGIFRPTPDSPDCIILLDAQKGTLGLPRTKTHSL